MNLTTRYQQSEINSSCLPDASFSTGSCRNDNVTPNCNFPSIFSTNDRARSNGDIGTLYFISREREGKQLDELIAKEIMELSVEERNQIVEEIHCVSTQKMEESPDFVCQRLESMEQEIQKISSNEKAAYDCALSLDKNYVEDRAFLLMFLRSEEFRPDMAAARFVRHFDYKLELFGKEKLVKNITYDDLDEEDRKCLNTGYIQIPGCKDVAGRSIMYFCADLILFATWDNLVRAMWYLTMVMLEDESAQRHGVVAVYLGFPGNALRHGYGRKRYVVQGAPFRIVATHFVCAGQNINAVTQYFLLHYGSAFRRRTRFIVEDVFVQCLYVLQSYGINPATVPCRPDGTPHADNVKDVLNARIAKEREIANVADDTIGNTIIKTTSDTARIFVQMDYVTPLDSDVLFGQGGRYRHQKGNALLDALIDKQLCCYEQLMTAFEKTCMVASIVQLLKESGARFLRFEKSSKEWIIVGELAAHKLVCARFRNKIRSKNG